MGGKFHCIFAKMMRASIFVCLLSVAFCQTFTGSWTDPFYGGTTYVCVDGSNIYAAYSGVGIAVGTVSGHTATGDWYEMGGDERNVHSITGTFEWNISSEGNTSTGSLYYPDDDDADATWDATRTSSTAPSATQCAALGSSGNVFGSWRSSGFDWHICDENGDEYTSSYESRTGSTGGYENGVYFQNGRIISGSWYNVDNTEGYALAFLLSNGDVQSYDLEINVGSQIGTVNSADLTTTIYADGRADNSFGCDAYQPRSLITRTSNGSPSSNSPSSSDGSTLMISGMLMMSVLALLFI